MSRSQLIDRAWILKMFARPSMSGRVNSILRSNRPGRINAGSSVSGRFVAISTLMLPRASKPSNWLMSSSIVRWTSLSPPAPSSNRAPPTASISSKNIMHAFLVRAISKSSLTIRAPSPTYFWTSSDMDLVLGTVDAYAHSFFNIRRRHLFAQVNDEFGELFDVDNVFGLVGVGADDFGTTRYLQRLFRLQRLFVGG